MEPDLTLTLQGAVGGVISISSTHYMVQWAVGGAITICSTYYTVQGAVGGAISISSTHYFLLTGGDVFWL